MVEGKAGKVVGRRGVLQTTGPGIPDREPIEPGGLEMGKGLVVDHKTVSQECEDETESVDASVTVNETDVDVGRRVNASGSDKTRVRRLRFTVSTERRLDRTSLGETFRQICVFDGLP